MNIKENIKRILLNGFIEVEDEAELTNDLPLISGGILDSITMLQLVDALEKEFKIEFEAHEIDRDDFDSIIKITTIVEKKMN